MTGITQSAGCKPFYEIYQVIGVENVLLFDNKNQKDQVKFYYITERVIELEIISDMPVLLYGNLLVKFKNMGTMSNQNLFRITFNTAFIGPSNRLEYGRWNISPENLHTDH